mmetsp:Transcript_21527/g.31974  ORF Transcript_21527/g.31974 Transcript_21527/m.31974 type:complete len:98 (+) Transcript_21527:91-384(+)|eukprot:CAMPEP_0201550280 /NCGR_PEP_ID=MMETSP0173_2-20130828/6668_1 /ASSEMBLY_ACC=CAM_ASM_000268 /TAXON_ID=218659 /ORGANISM="Vexillifera sp., Strain DIVA3 564/2" /LENGTH=97 /DNA_ID=CAMNT_0047960211 /DNA_START=66 /DNA_END=359 /DNA_ORIENTATION=+
MALVIRIKFPETYPIIYKNMRINGNLNVPAAIEYIANELSVPGGDNFGFYLPDRREWLPDNQPLNQIDELQEAEEVEFKDKFAVDDDNAGGGCCTIM